ncbi:MAG TPA: heme ABC exporter ATP-binding protein CcmA [Stellaceae bacterium]|nr:heme ABC exporter ATP-binding protein CcmA [Stellaceae bacterium]
MTQEPDLVGEGLACRRGERLVFEGLPFRLPAGGALVVSGANGSGKSSLLRLVASLFAPAAGRLLWGGRPVADDLAPYRARLEYVGHLDAVKPALSPRDMLRFWAALRGAGAAAPIDRALSAFALDAVADWPCRWLSAGQRRRLSLARLCLAPAPIWLLDEPFAALDRANQARLEAAIEAHRAAGGRVMLATHQPLALAGADSLALDDFARRPG